MKQVANHPRRHPMNGAVRQHRLPFHYPRRPRLNERKRRERTQFCSDNDRPVPVDGVRSAGDDEQQGAQDG